MEFTVNSNQFTGLKRFVSQLYTVHSERSEDNG